MDIGRVSTELNAVLRCRKPDDNGDIFNWARCQTDDASVPSMLFVVYNESNPDAQRILGEFATTEESAKQVEQQPQIFDQTELDSYWAGTNIATHMSGAYNTPHDCVPDLMPSNQLHNPGHLDTGGFSYYMPPGGQTQPYETEAMFSGAYQGMMGTNPSDAFPGRHDKAMQHGTHPYYGQTQRLGQPERPIQSKINSVSVILHNLSCKLTSQELFQTSPAYAPPAPESSTAATMYNHAYQWPNFGASSGQAFTYQPHIELAPTHGYWQDSSKLRQYVPSSERAEEALTSTGTRWPGQHPPTRWNRPLCLLVPK